MEPVIFILENRFSYGCEFYGNKVGVAMTAITERCFLAMTQVSSSLLVLLLVLTQMY